MLFFIFEKITLHNVLNSNMFPMFFPGEQVSIDLKFVELTADVLESYL